MNQLYGAIMDKIVEKTNPDRKSNYHVSEEMSEKVFVIPPARTRYLSEISETNRAYDKKAGQQAEVAQRLYGIFKTLETVSGTIPELDKAGIVSGPVYVNGKNKELLKLLLAEFDREKLNLDPYNWEIITDWNHKMEKYKAPVYSFKVRDKEINIETHTESLSHTQIPKVALPKYQGWGDILNWVLQENVPGEFPYTAGL